MQLYLNTRELFDCFDEKDLAVLLYDYDYIDINRLYEELELSSDSPLPRLENKRTLVDLDDFGEFEDDLLDKMWTNDIIDYLEREGHVIDPTMDISDCDEPEDKYDWIRDLKVYFNKNIERVATKEDFKKAICKLIDEGLYC